MKPDLALVDRNAALDLIALAGSLAGLAGVHLPDSSRAQKLAGQVIAACVRLGDDVETYNPQKRGWTMTEEAFANLRQICAGAFRVGELSREIRRSVAIGDGPAVARDAQALAAIAARIQFSESAVRQTLAEMDRQLANWCELERGRE